MIPKKIHYCWFGRGEKPKLAQKCIASWKKYCPDYEIIEWNEDNFDLEDCEYACFCYEQKRYAYLSDYVRLWAVEKYGGLYFDTDVELLKCPDELLINNAFFCFEGKQFVTTGLGFGAVAEHWSVKAMADAYRNISTDELRETLNTYGVLTGSPKMNTYAFAPYGLVQNGECQKVRDVQILSSDYLCPFDDITGELNINANSLAIHWYGKSANRKIDAVKARLFRPVRRMLKRIGVRYK